MWRFVVATYDGTGGPYAANGITLYVDYAPVAATATTNGSYVAMENRSAPIALGQRSNNTELFAGKIAGGTVGPFFVPQELTPAEVLNLYDTGRAALELP